MAAYLLSHVTIKDPELWGRYVRAVAGTFTPFGGEFVVRGVRGDVLAGKHSHTHMALIRFPNEDAVRDWYDSPAYQELAKVRAKAADVDFIVFREL
ncbi:MAG: DUF1330 domain-containing protein [Nitrospirae bacterium]|nr:DUF1330 domain-containing protein [Nitrospirota bacterium]